MRITFSDYDIEDGFAWIQFNQDDESFSFQACLELRADKKGYKKSINENDSGADWGLSGDANAKAIKKFGEDYCWEIFKREMRNKHKIKFTR